MTKNILWCNHFTLCFVILLPAIHCEVDDRIEHGIAHSKPITDDEDYGYTGKRLYLAADAQEQEQ